ncbi:unnamed protein product [Mesocestoides corti]|uniref:Uncharacterized protein n=1 Tax=Mesocestoides corti TaxID=53468 RepID=A0A3P6GJ15_MESCO|nr:unnamed protein product [Mesocestoides corti]
MSLVIVLGFGFGASQRDAYGFTMHCSQKCKHSASDRQPNPVFTSATNREARSALKCEYVRKIAADACMVGSLPTPQSTRVPPGLIRANEFYPCTYTTSSGYSGMKIYPYSDYRLCTFHVLKMHNLLLGECAADLRWSRQQKHLQDQAVCACANSHQPLEHLLPPQAPASRQSTSLSAVPRQYPQHYIRQTSVGAGSEVVLRHHPHHHNQHHLSRRDRSLLTTSMLVAPPSSSQIQHIQNPTAVAYHQQHPHRQSLPPVIGGDQQRFEPTAAVYAAMLKEVHIR